ncbi:hypothetical protein OIV83_001730 [Microbotryomycetes sp. JL201]|nr:hypothetical protein OIV83_001730 [Microbotryomycetes sp. JL201]
MRARLQTQVQLSAWTAQSLASSALVRRSYSGGSSAQIPTPVAIPASTLRDKVQLRIRRVDQTRGPANVSAHLVDSFGRQHDYLRISLTEKCNLRCTYCMPEQGVPLLPQDNLLTADEIERTAKMFVSNGVTKIRLTGGEPTVRKDLIDIDFELTAYSSARLGRLPLASLGMTSNGIALKRKLPALVNAGLTHLNISLDTLDPFKYEIMTRRRGFQAVLDSIETAMSLKDAGLRLKINVVVIRGVNDMEVADFVEMTRERDITVRMIEYMPFEDNKWSTEKLVPSSTLVNRLQTRYPGLHKLIDPKSDTTRSWKVPGFKGTIGFISSMSNHFCGECSRLRVGPDGGVKVCLFGPPVLALRPLLRDPTCTDDKLMHQVGRAVLGKHFAHNGLGGAQGIKEKGKMGPMVGIGDPTTGRPSMVSVSDKGVTTRTATAVGTIFLNKDAFDLIEFSSPVSDAEPASRPLKMHTKKGDVLTTAQLAAIMAAKSTSALIPLCHPLMLTSIKVDLTPIVDRLAVQIRATVECRGQTGVEMEALTSVSVGLLTVWDMVKAVAGQEARIGDVYVESKKGGKSGDWTRRADSGR